MIKKIILISILVFGLSINFSYGEEKMFVHGFYAINSYDQFSSMEKNKSIKNIDSLGFGWSRLTYDEEQDSIILNMKPTNNNDFYVPYGYEDPLKIANKYEISTGLNVYAKDNLSKILEKEHELVEILMGEINSNNISGKNINFNSIIIDFENLKESERDNFSNFLRNLKGKLSENNKELYVMVPASDWYKSYDYKTIGEIADKVIVMAHDYDFKNIQIQRAETVYSPLGPIDNIRKTLDYITNEETGIEDKKKILLQINFGTSQWKIKDGYIYTQTKDNIAYSSKPTYEKIYERVEREIEKGNSVDNIIFYDIKSKSPCITYYNGEDSTKNIIWYEDKRSVFEKINLVDEFGLGGISIWRIGSIPEFYSSGKTSLHLDVWQEIQSIF
ncbi:MAG: glycosyl hydrolase family 18 protein [Anaeromicrobium sp.]|jgi:spore germination protein YaaH|uniref:glycosyl hydrolase family 18 protein n=1 Tax=Anaeromicrobium sp. TaxID=1929132 RepID=UPI0025E16B37|nr:glycosyl hydrolase family 18 protein [Anaeromicrobium sp.]MCT4593387.1 glycosyl hydrolase family 18 protein [Anaeromicrobium sp.]